jgi:hypothetical protein
VVVEGHPVRENPHFKLWPRVGVIFQRSCETAARWAKRVTRHREELEFAAEGLSRCGVRPTANDDAGAWTKGYV